jgi:iron complex outermembrane receptor protein
MDLRQFTLDVMVRKVGALPEPALDEYSELNARLAWRVNERIEVAVKGFNLLNETHLEYPAPEGRAIQRSVMAEMRYSY